MQVPLPIRVLPENRVHGSARFHPAAYGFLLRSNALPEMVLLATLCTSLFFVFSQIKIRYSIKYSDALSVRLFYTVPSVIIYEFLLIIRVLPIFDEPPCDNNKRSRNLPDQSLVSCFPLHHMGFPICKQYYDNLIC